MSLWIEFCNLSTVGLCLIFKIPQIITVVKSKSVAGISINSVIAELLAYTINLTYNISQGYPMSSYFEYYFTVPQDIFLLFTLYYYSGSLNLLKYAGMGLFLTVFYGLSIGIPNPNIILVLIKLAGIIGASSKMLQLTAILKTKDSENVSVTSWSISAYTCITRIMTTMALTADTSLLINFTVALILNTLIITSSLYYRQGNGKNKNG